MCNMGYSINGVWIVSYCLDFWAGGQWRGCLAAGGWRNTFRVQTHTNLRALSCILVDGKLRSLPFHVPCVSSALDDFSCSNLFLQDLAMA